MGTAFAGPSRSPRDRTRRSCSWVPLQWLHQGAWNTTNTKSNSSKARSKDCSSKASKNRVLTDDDAPAPSASSSTSTPFFVDVDGVVDDDVDNDVPVTARFVVSFRCGCCCCCDDDDDNDDDDDDDEAFPIFLASLPPPGPKNAA